MRIPLSSSFKFPVLNCGFSTVVTFWLIEKYILLFTSGIFCHLFCVSRRSEGSTSALNEICVPDSIVGI